MKNAANPREHPEYTHEAAHLAGVLTQLDLLLAARSRAGASGADNWTTAVLAGMREESVVALAGARGSPYFGRIDFSPENEGCESLYIGKVGFSGSGQRPIVIDWNAPIAGLFYRGRPGRTSYKCPEGRVAGELLLKRQIAIENSELKTIADVFDLRKREPQEAQPVLVDPDEYLREVLRAGTDAKLRDIVTTIQREQYELISADPAQVLLVQGAAGTGKTSIALHRLAFLLYPSRSSTSGRAGGLEPQRCIIFGPNQMFLSYVAGVLPSLNVAGIPQSTLTSWSCEQMGLKLSQVKDLVLETLLRSDAPREERALAYRKSRLKNSRKMLPLLGAWVERLRAMRRPPAQELSTTPLGPMLVRVRLSAEELSQIYESLAGLPLVRHRERFLETVVTKMVEAYRDAVDQTAEHESRPGQALLAEADRLFDQAEKYAEMLPGLRRERDELVARREDPTSGSLVTGSSQPPKDDELKEIADGIQAGADALRRLALRRRRRGEGLLAVAKGRLERAKDEVLVVDLRKELGRFVQEQYDTTWPKFDAQVDYYAMYEDAKFWAESAPRLVQPEDIQLLEEGKRHDSKRMVDESDLAAMHVLWVLANGLPNGLYDHVVVDEAQDVSPLYFELLQRYSRNKSMTVLGDLSQGIYSHRGIANWEEAEEAFRELPHSRHIIRRSYRSTTEITTFANQVIRPQAQKGQEAALAEPFERHGQKPGVHYYADRKAMVAAIPPLVRSLCADGCSNVAIIVKSTAQRTDLARELYEAGLRGLQEVDDAGADYKGGVVLATVHMAKGMEFDAAIVAGADAETYSETRYDARLLYVAITRATHVLHVMSHGSLSPHLEPALGLADVQGLSWARRVWMKVSRRESPERE